MTIRATILPYPPPGPKSQYSRGLADINNMPRYPHTEPEQNNARQATERSLDFLSDVSLRCSVVFGNCTISIRELLSLAPGSVLELGKTEGEPLDFVVNGKTVGHGEMVAVNDHYGVRITEIVDTGEKGQ